MQNWQDSILKLAQDILAGKRLSLAKGLTLVESTLEADIIKSDFLLNYIAKNHAQCVKSTSPFALKIGITGPPGAGKSSLIEAIGLMLADDGFKIAVLAVDPSSPVSGGSILGDKTRMELLSRHKNSFIRPAPSGTHHGGLHRRSAEAVFLLEKAGFDIILIETVGVGQGEYVIKTIADFTLLVLPPASGDALQGMKKGIVEMADLLLINKADGTFLDAARITKNEYDSALRLLGRKTKVEMVSSFTHNGIDILKEEIIKIRDELSFKKTYINKRESQYKAWFNDEISAEFLTLQHKWDKNQKLHDHYQTEMLEGAYMPAAAARAFVQALLNQHVPIKDA